MAPRTARRVNAFVHVTNPDTAELVVLAPGDELPAWANKLVTNPKVFATTDAQTEPNDGAGDGGETKPATGSTPRRTRRAAKKKDGDDAATPETTPTAPDTGDGEGDGSGGDGEDAGDDESATDDDAGESGDEESDDDSDGADDEPPTFKG